MLSAIENHNDQTQNSTQGATNSRLNQRTFAFRFFYLCDDILNTNLYAKQERACYMTLCLRVYLCVSHKMA